MFKSAFIYQAPDADPKIHNARIKTEMLDLSIVVIQMQNFAQGIEVCKSLVQNDGVQNIILCPGFPHEVVAQVKKVVGDNVSVAVVRTDTPNNLLVVQMLTKEGWFTKNH